MEKEKYGDDKEEKKSNKKNVMMTIWEINYWSCGDVLWQFEECYFLLETGFNPNLIKCEYFGKINQPKK